MYIYIYIYNPHQLPGPPSLRSLPPPSSTVRSKELIAIQAEGGAELRILGAGAAVTHLGKSQRNVVETLENHRKTIGKWWLNGI